jgi:hypothetical protein
MEALMRLAARSVDDLRAMLAMPEFKIGHEGKRLSPIERFPIVRLDNSAGGEPRYVVPNHRHLAKSFIGVVDFTLREALTSDYEHARGALFHLYLRQLIEDRLPQTTVIPETRYAKAGGGEDSPDLTLIDQNAKRIVAVEVKGRRINLSTRIALGDKEMKENLGDAFKALRNLPGKVVEMRAGRPEFKPWQADIAATGDSPPVLVAVLREGLYQYSHLLREWATSDPEHPLHGLAGPYCLLSADDFEKAVEVARLKGRSLAELLNEHYEISGSRDYAAPAADTFGDSIMPVPDSFASSFLKKPEWARE